MPFGYGVWRNIMKGWEVSYNNISFKVGEGSRVSFWGQKWCGDLVLKYDFPDLYRVSCQRKCSVQQVGGTRRETFWDLFPRLEVIELQRLPALLHKHNELVASLQARCFVLRGGK